MPLRLRLMRLMSASLLVLPLSISLILLTDCLNVAKFLVVAELVAVKTLYVEVPPLSATPLAESKLEREIMSE